MRDKSDLYYECHVTIVPVEGAMLDCLHEFSKIHGFRVSTFVMLKDGTIPNAFTSARDESYARMVTRMKDFIGDLQALGLEILRYKIEDTILDTNHGGDVLGLLSPKVTGKVTLKDDSAS